MASRAGWDRVRRPPLVLAYHRVAELTADPQRLAVSPANFSAHLDVLARLARPVSLERLTSALMDRRLSPNTVAVTFDDGYADNLARAKPLLERHEIPAIVFVATGFLGTEHGFWWDELERLVLLPDKLPPKLRLEVTGHVHQWDLGSPVASDAHSRSGSRSGRVLAPPEPDARQSLYQHLSALLRHLDADERSSALDELRIWSPNRDASAVPVSDRPLLPEEVAALAAGGLVEIGSHTHTHAALAGLPAERKSIEIEFSRARLEGILDRPVTSFAYPYGSFDSETTAVVRALGFVRACTTRPTVIRPDSDPLQIPRFVVQDWDGDEFERRLRRLFSP